MRETVIKYIQLDPVKTGEMIWDLNPKPSYISLMVDNDHQTVSYEWIGGAMPAFESLASLLLKDRDVLKLMKTYMKGYRRKYPCRLRSHIGFSGCMDFDLCIPDCRRGYEPHLPSITLFEQGKRYKKAACLHITCAGKAHIESPIWIGDLVDLLRTMASPRHNTEFDSARYISPFDNWGEYLGYIKSSPKRFKYLPLKEDSRLGDVLYGGENII